MKKFILFAVLITSSTRLLSQKIIDSKNVIIEKDGSVKELPYTLKKGSVISFTVKGWNQYVMKGSSAPSGNDISIEIPELITSLQKTWDKDDSEKTQDPATLLDPMKIASIPAYKDVSGFVDAVSSVRTTILKIRSLVYFEKLIRLYLQENKLEKASLVTSISNYLSSIGIGDPQNGIDSAFKELEQHFSSAKKEYYKLNKPEIILKDTLKINLARKTDKTIVLSRDIPVQFTSENIMENEFRALTELYNYLTKDSVQEKIILSVNRGADLFNRIKCNSCDVEIVFGPFQVGFDENIYRLYLHDSKGSKIDSIGPFKLFGTGGWKVDVSAGYALSFKGDDNFSIVPDTAGKAIGIREAPTNSISHSIVAMIHAYPRLLADFNPCISAGFSLPVNGGLNFYLGAGLLFFNKNRLAISGGLSFLRLKRLNTANLNMEAKQNGNIPFISKNNFEIKYDEVFKRSGFLSLTYNIGTIKN